MSRRGVWQLKSLTFSYCQFSGSSKGAREVVAEYLPRFQQDNPQLQLVTQVRPGRHPFLDAQYANKRTRTVGIENHTPAEILRHMIFLRSSVGRKTANKIKHRTVTDRPSIQGTWTPSMQAQLSSPL
ncbi:hypothetical protein WJX72_000542 [[Myrmecia] bisecta]|uniref:Large ribosomal subunit protein mL43 n=1 Tax=[Myrmecia] bisecta TaxID=41462 RepID=A0AAW1R4H3_9CHLO